MEATFHHGQKEIPEPYSFFRDHEQDVFQAASRHPRSLSAAMMLCLYQDTGADCRLILGKSEARPDQERACIGAVFGGNSDAKSLHKPQLWDGQLNFIDHLLADIVRFDKSEVLIDKSISPLEFTKRVNIADGAMIVSFDRQAHSVLLLNGNAENCRWFIRARAAMSIEVRVLIWTHSWEP